MASVFGYVVCGMNSMENLTTQPVSSPFRRWGSSSSSLKSRGGRVHSQRHPRRPNSLAASDHDMYTKCGDGDDQSTCESETQGSGSGRGGVASWSAAFERLLEDTSGLHTFAEFLKKEFSAENIYFWTACERYRFLTNPTERAKEAQSIFTRHLGSAATEPVNVDSPARQLAQDNLHAAEKDLFLQAQKQIFNLMKFDSYPRFLRSDLHKLCVEAEAAKKPLPFPGDKLDECLKTRATLSTPSKLKKSASNAEDKRRKSLLPWHRKARCKSKDRGEQEYSGNQQAGIKGAAAQGGLSVSKSLDVHSSRSSLASWDAALSGQSVTSSGPATEETSNSSKSTLCRVFLSDGATTVMQTKPQDTVKQLIEKLLDKRGLTYLAYEVYIVGTNNKSVDVQESSTVLAGREVIVEQRVMFKLDLPNRKVISVRSKVNKILGEVLRPILHKYNYRLDLVQVLLNPDSTENLDMSLSVLAVDGHRLSIQCKPAEGWKGEVTQISTTNPLAVTAKIRNGTQGTVPVPSLDEITNRVFKDILQVKAEGHNEPEKISDQSSVKSEDYGSETSSGIFGRFLRRDSNAPPRTHRTKKLGIAPVPASIIPKPVTGSTEEISEASHKPLIAKWKAGVKLQMTGRSESDELVEGLNRAQRARLEDQRGTEINFELPDFLKDKENYQGVAKLRKLKRNVESQPILPSEACQRICDENLNITHVSHSNLPTPSIRISPGITKPNPAPRLSIGQTQSPNKYNSIKETVQTKVHELEKNLGKLNLNNSLQSPIKSGFNSLETTVIENCVADSTIICNQIDNLNQSFSSCDSKHDDRIIKHDRNNSTSSSDLFNNDILNSSFKSTSSENDRHKNCSDPPPLPPKPKILPIKPSNWGHNLNTNDNVFNLSQERMRPSKISASSDNLVARSAYLDQPSSSFV